MNNVTWIIVCVFASSAFANEGPDFVNDVRPVLNTYCVGCHNADDAAGKLSLESYVQIQQGGQHGPVLVPGQAAASRLIRVLTGDVEPTMPPDDELQPSRDEVALLRAWIDAGATGPAGEKPDRTLLLVPAIPPVTSSAQPVTALDYSPDGVLLAVARFSAVELLSTEDDRLVARLPDHLGKITDISFSPGGEQLVVASGIAGLAGEAVLWNVGTHERIGTVRGHRDLIQAVDVDPSGRLLATASYDRTAILWDLVSGEQLQMLRGHNGAIYDVAFSPDGDVLATASGDATIKLWRVETGERLDTLTQPLKEQYTVDFSPDGNFLLAGGADSRLRRWEFVSRETPQINPLKDARFAHEVAVSRLAFVGDGQFVISVGDDSTLKLWNTDRLTEAHVYDVQPAQITSIAVSPVGDRFTVGRMDGTFASLDVVRSKAAALVAPPTFVPRPATTGPMEELEEAEPNDNPSTAMMLTGASRISGVIQRVEGGQQADADLFRFRSARGAQWIVETRAAQIESPLDTHVEVLDAEGNPVLHTILQAVRDSYLTFDGRNSTIAGTFRLHNWEEMKINQFLYIEGEVMRLYVYPRGPDSGFDMYPGRGSRYTYFNTTALAHALHAPSYVVEAHAPGTPLIPNGLPVFDVYFANDDDPLRRLGNDSRLTFTAPEEGEYLMRLRDARGWEGADYRYELILRPPRPDFSVKLEGADPKIFRGSGKAFQLIAERTDGFDGEIRIDIANLPSGFSVNSPLIIEAGHNRAHGVINAAFDAPDPTEAQAQGSKLIATAVVDSKEVVRHVNNLGNIQLEPDSPQILTRLLPAEADEQYDPFTGIPRPEELTIRPGETITARLVVQRQGEEGAIKFGGLDSGKNLPHGLYVDNIGLNGVVVMPNTAERTVFITADDWVREQSSTLYFVTGEGGGHATWPVILHIRQATEPASEESTSTGSEAPAG